MTKFNVLVKVAEHVASRMVRVGPEFETVHSAFKWITEMDRTETNEDMFFPGHDIFIGSTDKKLLWKLEMGCLEEVTR